MNVNQSRRSSLGAAVPEYSILVGVLSLTLLVAIGGLSSALSGGLSEAAGLFSEGTGSGEFAQMMGGNGPSGGNNWELNSGVGDPDSGPSGGTDQVVRWDWDGGRDETGDRGQP